VPANIFGGVTVSNIPLYVPAGTVSLYQTAPVWKDFYLTSSTNNLAKNSVNVSVYPNPVSNQLNIGLSPNLQLENIKIYNQIGQLVLQSKNTTINVNHLQKGVYFAQIQTNKGKTTKKVVIN